MDREQKRLYTIEILSVMAVLLCVAYILFRIYFKPFELIGDAYVDEMLVKMNRQSIALFLFVGPSLSLTISSLLVTFFESFITNFMPTVEVQAKLASKEHYYKSAPSSSSSAIYAVYELNFILGENKEKKFKVDPILYAAYFEGNKGVLKYKEHVFRKLVGFYVEEVE